MRRTVKAAMALALAFVVACGGDSNDDDDDAGNKLVTHGEFGLLLAGTLATLPDDQGSSTSGTVNGSPWTAATSLVTLRSGSLVVNVSNTSRILGVVMTGFQGPGTHHVGLLAGKAAASALVPATGASGTLTITNLAFDIGRL